MFKLATKDIMVNFSKKFTNLFLILLIVPTAALFVDRDSIYILIFHIPTLITLYLSIPMDIDEIKLNHNVLIQSLPVKRWEYVVSKYIIFFINYIFMLAYTLLLLKILSFLGYDHLKYIQLTSIKEAAIITIFTFAILIPISFIFFSRWRIFFGIFILSMIAQNYNYVEYGGTLNSLIYFSRRNTSPIILILILVISIGISIVVYNNKDLS